MSYFKPTQWNALCDICGFKFKSSELRTDWRGLKVCNQDYEQRHPQELIRIPSDNPSVSWTRPESTEDFVVICDLFGSSAIPNQSIPNCMIPNKNIPGNLI